MLKNPPVKKMSELLQNSSLAKLVQRSNRLNELNLQIQHILPLQYRGLYRIVNLYDNLLIFDVQNATVRQGLMLQQSYLLSLIQRELPEVEKLQFNVNPNFKPL